MSDFVQRLSTARDTIESHWSHFTQLHPRFVSTAKLVLGLLVIVWSIERPLRAGQRFLQPGVLCTDIELRIRLLTSLAPPDPRLDMDMMRPHLTQLIQMVCAFQKRQIDGLSENSVLWTLECWGYGVVLMTGVWVVRLVGSVCRVCLATLEAITLLLIISGWLLQTDVTTNIHPLYLLCTIIVTLLYDIFVHYVEFRVLVFSFRLASDCCRTCASALAPFAPSLVLSSHEFIMFLLHDMVALHNAGVAAITSCIVAGFRMILGGFCSG